MHIFPNHATEKRLAATLDLIAHILPTLIGVNLLFDSLQRAGRGDNLGVAHGVDSFRVVPVSFDGYILASAVLVSSENLSIHIYSTIL